MKQPIHLIVLSTMVATLSAHAQRPGRARPELTEEQTAFLEERGTRDVRIHDPSTIVKCKDTYWIFYTGGGIPSYHSKDLKTWERGPTVFREAPAWQAEAVPNNRGTDYWAPDMVYHNGKYLLFFSISSFGANTSAIGVTTNKTLDPDDPDYKWSDPKLVIQSDPSCDYNTIDPGVIVDQEGRLWMSFGSFWSGIKLIELDPDTGLRIAPDSPVTALASYNSIEAPHLYFHDGYYYLFLNWGMCCRGANSTYNIRVGRSKTITGPYLDQNGEDMRAGGGSLLLDTDGIYVGPGHAGIWKEGDEYLMGMHFYNGAMNGASQYALRPLIWDDQGWPVIEKSNSDAKAENLESVEIKITKDITYREGESEAWKLDIAMPETPADGLRPALVIVHGGGWSAGDKSDAVYQTMMKEYAQLGYVTINVNYRLTREAEFPACIEDVKCAVRWLRAHADEYQVDPDRIGSYGHSAGAHLSLMLAMAPKSAGLEGDGGWDDYSSVVNAAAAGSPPTELGRGGPMAQSEWWPIDYIGGDHPPLFLIQGLQDPIVRPELTTDFVEKMKAAGADIKYMTLEGDHDVAYSDHLDVTKPALEAFFAEHL